MSPRRTMTSFSAFIRLIEWTVTHLHNYILVKLGETSRVPHSLLWFHPILKTKFILYAISSFSILQFSISSFKIIFYFRATSSSHSFNYLIFHIYFYLRQHFYYVIASTVHKISISSSWKRMWLVGIVAVRYQKDVFSA